MCKKLIALLLLMAMIVCFASCNKETKPSDDSTTPQTQEIPYVDDGFIHLIIDGVCAYGLVYTAANSSVTRTCSEKVAESITDLTGTAPNCQNDLKYDANTPEIVFGYTERYAESVQVYGDLKANEYGLFRIGRKIIVAGHTAEALNMATDELIALIGSEKTGNGVSIANEKLQVRKIADTFAASVFKAGKYDGGYDLANGNICLIYRETTAQDYVDYCNQLKGSGYRLTDSLQIGNNRYSTFTSANGLTQVEYTDYNKTVAIVTDPLKSTAVKESEPMEWEKVTENRLTVLSLDYSGNESSEGFVLTLEDGRFVIIDGGVGADSSILWNYLQNNNKRTDGVKIAAWILSHSHPDHYGCFEMFANTHGSDVTVEYVIANPVTAAICTQENTGFLLNSLKDSMKKLGGNPVFVKAHTGQTFTFCNVDFEMLYTQESMISGEVTTTANQNETSLVFRMKANDKTVLFLNDIESCTKILNYLYGSELKADIMQVNHHGYSASRDVNVTRTEFDAVDPQYIIFCSKESAFEQRYQNPTEFQVPIKELVDKIKAIGENNCIVADGGHTEIYLHKALPEILIPDEGPNTSITNGETDNTGFGDSGEENWKVEF